MANMCQDVVKDENPHFAALQQAFIRYGLVWTGLQK
jgi:hypothetical protein